MKVERMTIDMMWMGMMCRVFVDTMRCTMFGIGWMDFGRWVDGINMRRLISLGCIAKAM